MNQFWKLLAVASGFILAMAIYAKAFVRYPVQIEQIMAGSTACQQHGGAKQYHEADTPTGFSVTCNNDTTIAGTITTTH